MPSYVVLLRAVNIGKRQVKMASLREWLAEEGFTDVETYIQTGNVKVASRMRSAAKVEASSRRSWPSAAASRSSASSSHPELTRCSPTPRARPAVRRRCRPAALRRVLQGPSLAEHVEAMAAYDPPDERIWAVGRAAHVWIRAASRTRRCSAPSTRRSRRDEPRPQGGPSARRAVGCVTPPLGRRVRSAGDGDVAPGPASAPGPGPACCRRSARDRLTAGRRAEVAPRCRHPG